MRVIKSIVLLLILSIAILIATSFAKIGYEVDVRVNSSSWDVHRSTQSLFLELNNSITGSGYFTRSSNVQGFAGMKSKDSTISTSGNLEYSGIERIIAREGPVIITTTVKSNTNESENVTQTRINESAKIKIDEYWPTWHESHKKITYFGPGIRTEELYNNNGDIVATAIDSWKLEKESHYLAHINRSVILANITSTSIDQDLSTNKTSIYSLDMESIGSSTNLDMRQTGPSGDGVAHLSQNYLGQEKIVLDLTMANFVRTPKEGNNWMNCCFGNANASDLENESNISYPSLLNFIYFGGDLK